MAVTGRKPSAMGFLINGHTSPYNCSENAAKFLSHRCIGDESSYEASFNSILTIITEKREIIGKAFTGNGGGVIHPGLHLPLQVVSQVRQELFRTLG